MTLLKTKLDTKHGEVPMSRTECGGLMLHYKTGDVFVDKNDDIENYYDYNR